jgi:metal-responsive CopG/Arc/MetJ family transcriptional regulator
MSNRKTVPVGVSMPPALRDRTDKTAQLSNMSRSQIICMALEEFLNRPGPKIRPRRSKPTTEE